MRRRILLSMGLVMVLATAICCGGGGDGDSDDNGTVNASVRFYNDLMCVDNSFTATLTVCGQTFTSVTSEWSSCEDITPGTCTVSLHAQTADCGTLSDSTSYSFEEGSVYSFGLFLKDEKPALLVKIQSGDCSTSAPSRTGVGELEVDMEQIETVMDTFESSAGLQSID